MSHDEIQSINCRLQPWEAQFSFFILVGWEKNTFDVWQPCSSWKVYFSFSLGGWDGVGKFDSWQLNSPPEVYFSLLVGGGVEKEGVKWEVHFSDENIKWVWNDLKTFSMNQSYSTKCLPWQPYPVCHFIITNAWQKRMRNRKFIFFSNPNYYSFCSSWELKNNKYSDLGTFIC